MDRWLPHKLKLPRKHGHFFYVVLGWAAWKIRNKMAIKKKFPSLTDALFFWDVC
jgi:hypothetical protein